MLFHTVECNLRQITGMCFVFNLWKETKKTFFKRVLKWRCIVGLKNKKSAIISSEGFVWYKTNQCLYKRNTSLTQSGTPQGIAMFALYQWRAEKVGLVCVCSLTFATQPWTWYYTQRHICAFKCKMSVFDLHEKCMLWSVLGRTAGQVYEYMAKV